jgi:glycosyltransferase involved in cell wall biosynthesis
MKLLIVTYAPMLWQGDRYYSYAPYVKEMEIWIKFADEIAFCCPTNYSGKDLLLSPFSRTDFKIFNIPELQIKDILKPWKLLRTTRVLISAMRWTDHIHLRCPGNVGLLGCIVQIFFPHKTKTAKYAGNWDWKSKQPWSYRVQQIILRNTYITKNMSVLVYGNWPDRTKNIKPFFTASYSTKDKKKVIKPDIKECIRLAFVGILSENKNPEISLIVAKKLKEEGLPVKLTYCGDGPRKELLYSRIVEWQMENEVELLGNVSSEKVMEILQQSHFLVFISRSEGWPKAVAEAMWWGCLPVTTRVSCVPQMIGDNERGFLTSGSPDEISAFIKSCFYKDEKLSEMSEKASDWSMQYTIERFEEEIRLLGS